MSFEWSGTMVLLCLAVGLTSGVARAQGASAPTAGSGALAASSAPSSGVTPAPPFFSGRRWYGSQLLISDAVSLALVGGGLEVANSDLNTGGEVLLLGLGTYVLAPPIINAAHDRWGIAAASLGLRIMAPSIGASIGAAIGPSDPTPSGETLLGSCDGARGNPTGAGVGALVGVILASALDAGLLSYENPEPEARATSTFGLAPALSADGKRGELRAYGTF